MQCSGYHVQVRENQRITSERDRYECNAVATLYKASSVGPILLWVGAARISLVAKAASFWRIALRNSVSNYQCLNRLKTN